MTDLAAAQYFAELCGTFVEATVHEILHQRGVYSSELFTRHRLYGIMVRKARHPQLNDHIHSVVQSLQARPAPVPQPCSVALSRAAFLPGCTRRGGFGSAGVACRPGAALTRQLTGAPRRSRSSRACWSAWPC